MPPVLKFFDSKLPTKISFVASLKGLGAVLEQKHNDSWYPVGYASRSLTSAERNYCQLEKKKLLLLLVINFMILFVVKSFMFNGHLPLQSIFKRSILQAPRPIQRFLLWLQRHDFEMHYIQGKLLTVAHALSRASLTDSSPEIEGHWN